MTRLERQTALETIVDCEIRCHGWDAAGVGALREEITAWWQSARDECEAYLVAASAQARADLAAVFGGAVA